VPLHPELKRLGAIEYHAFPREPVNVRTLDVIATVAAQFRPQIVHGDE